MLFEPKHKLLIVCAVAACTQQSNLPQGAQGKENINVETRGGPGKKESKQTTKGLVKRGLRGKTKIKVQVWE